ncbi:MAG: Crp/Fnr family transcriptional regulator [Gammaproteobacteria bacterium]|nr:Crp/Fnr family transcriptional regulator [Gammaproteobacteria bacterium]
MIDLLAKLPPYDLLDEKGRESLMRISVRRTYRKNRVVIQQGDDSNTMFVLFEGEMKVYVEDDQGKQLTVRMLKSGDSFGEVALIGDFPRTASVATLTDCVVYAFSKENYLAFLRAYPEILLALSKTLANRLRDTTEELGSIALSDVYGRVRYIFNKYALNGEGQVQVPKFTHREISGMIGSSREMVSKILKELEKGEYISCTQKHYIIKRTLPVNW